MMREGMKEIKGSNGDARVKRINSYPVRPGFNPKDFATYPTSIRGVTLESVVKDNNPHIWTSFGTDPNFFSRWHQLKYGNYLNILDTVQPRFSAMLF
jgi:hypothetical protein